MSAVEKAEHPHGSYLRYVSGKCRCTLCRAANAAYMRAYLKTHPEQVEKANARKRVTSGTMVKCTGPGKKLYWPGLSKRVPRAFKVKVSRELAQANERAHTVS